MSEMTVTDVATTIDTYLAAYGEPDAARRRELVDQVWAEGGQLVDPPADAEGLDAISAMGDLVQEHFAGHTFRRTTGIDQHHGVARYGWELVDPDGAVAIAGIDVATLDADGRLARVTGFFGDLPGLEG